MWASVAIEAGVQGWRCGQECRRYWYCRASTSQLVAPRQEIEHPQFGEGHQVSKAWNAVAFSGVVAG